MSVNAARMLLVFMFGVFLILLLVYASRGVRPAMQKASRGHVMDLLRRGSGLVLFGGGIDCGFR